MPNLQIAHRYAEALMEEAEELKVLKEVSDDLRFIQKIVRQSNEFRSFLKSPVIKNEKKREVINAALGKSIHELTLKFLFLLTEKERENDLLHIIDAFFILQEESMGIVKVDIRSASELSADQMERLKTWLEKYLNKKVRFEMKIDREIIGGFVAAIGDTVFDGSVKHQLELLHERFKEAPALA
jgi:F-type H+-transporting ATPase subunit delta